MEFDILSYKKSEADKLIKDLWLHPHKLGNMLGYKYLQEEHSKWIRYVFLAKKDNTLLAFRGSYKTTAITVIGTVWYLFFFPNKRVLVGSSTADNAKKILQEIRGQYKKAALRSLYQLTGIYEPINPDWWRNDSFCLTTKTKTTKEGNVESVGAGGVVTSRHYDKILNDDLVVLKDRISRAERERKKEWVKELQSIIEPDGTISYIGTPWHPEDIYSITPKPLKRPVGTVFNPRLTKDRLNEIRRMQGEVFYRTQYDLEHISAEDMIFDNPLYHEYPIDRVEEKPKNIAYLDPAFGGKDFSALTIGAKKDKKLYIKAGDIWHGTIDKTYDRVERMYRKYNLITLYVESNAAQRTVAEEFKRRGLHVKEIINIKNKHLRIMNHVLVNWDRIYFSKNVSDLYMQQLLDYGEESEHDDAPDSLAGLSAVMLGKRGFKFLRIGGDGIIVSKEEKISYKGILKT